MASLLALAGCSSFLGAAGGGTGTVNFYMSDQPGAIDDFEHLNVTVDSVTFVRANGNRTTYEANETVDMTQLEGSNATLIEAYEVEAGNYTKVFLSVADVDATFAGDASGDVKVPSEKLQLTNNFTVESNESVDFVYDVMVTKAGDSGTYVLRPVVSESGTDVEIDEVDATVEAGASAEADGNA